jgi:hypothetical protein
VTNSPDLILFVLAVTIPIFLLIAYLTILMMDLHSKENDDE